MADYKGTGVVSVREAIQKRGSQAENSLFDLLTSEEKQVYLKTMPIHHIPIEQGTAIIVKAASVLYPQDNLAVHKLGFEMADHDLKGIYRFMVKLATVPFIIKQAASLWKVYSVKGRAWAEPRGEKSAVFLLEGYPELPERFREMMSGYIQGTLSFTGVKNIKITRQNDDPNVWKWPITWE